MPVRAWMCCASNSASTICSVKNLEVMTSCGRAGWRQAEESKAISNRTLQATRFISRPFSKDASDNSQSALEHAQKKIRQQCQQRRRNCASEYHGVADHCDTAKNECTEAAGANGRRDGGDADGNHSRGSNAGQNKTGCQRKTHTK